MARALIVGCGCRGRELGARLLAEGWQVRGTSRDAGGAGALEAAGLEAAIADPDRPATVLDQVHDVAVVVWLLGSALGEPELIAAIHGPRLERLLEKLVDTPVRGFVYEAAGRVQAHHLRAGAEVVRAAARRWSIPVEIVEAEPDDVDAWASAMAAAIAGLVA
jgi:uncharacterized protein YbjT (DUF2867 family)